MLDVTYTMSRKVERLKYTEIYKDQNVGGETGQSSMACSLPGPGHFKSLHGLSFEHLFFQ